MKTKFGCCLGLLLFCWSTMNAEVEVDGTYSAETLPHTEKMQPFKIKVTGNSVGSAKFEEHGFKHHRYDSYYDISTTSEESWSSEDPRRFGRHGYKHSDTSADRSIVSDDIRLVDYYYGFKDDKIRFDEVNAEARAVFYYNQKCKEGLYATLGYSYDHIKTPFFRQSDFNNASLAIGGFTERVCHWLWLAEVKMSINTDHFNIADYAYYDILLWGRYAYSPTINIHAGFLVETGMRIDWIWPIVGFDWQPNDSWKLNLVFPVNISAQYFFTKCLSVALAARFWQIRQRVGGDEPIPNGLLTYKATGIEVAANYDCSDWLILNVHGGYNCGGVFKIANHRYEHKHRFDFNGAGYVGGEVAVRF